MHSFENEDLVSSVNEDRSNLKVKFIKLINLDKI